MKIGNILMEGANIGFVSFTYGEEVDTTPVLSGTVSYDDAHVDVPHGNDGAHTRHHSASMRASDHPHGHDGAHTRHHSKSMREEDHRQATGGAHLRDHVKKNREADQTKRAGASTLGKGEDPRGLESYIRSEAIKNNVDPDVAVRVAKSEGLRDPVGDRGQSHGAFQLYKGGGLGNEYQKQTGRDLADPKNEKDTISWALKNVGRTGWEPYHGAARVGIGRREGIGRSVVQEGLADKMGIRGGANYMRGQHGAAGDRSNLTQITLNTGKTVSVHKDASESFRGFLNELEGSGYKINDVQGFADRSIRGSSRASQHAYGNAIDVNPGKNPMGYGPLQTDLPANVSDMAAKYGLSWGGDWRGRKDAMHFEWMGSKPWKSKTASKAFDPETMAP